MYTERQVLRVSDRGGVMGPAESLELLSTGSVGSLGSIPPWQLLVAVFWVHKTGKNAGMSVFDMGACVQSFGLDLLLRVLPAWKGSPG